MGDTQTIQKKNIPKPLQNQNQFFFFFATGFEKNTEKPSTELPQVPLGPRTSQCHKTRTNVLSFLISRIVAHLLSYSARGGEV